MSWTFVLVVAGKNEAALAPVVYANGASLVVNPDPDRGQFSSLQAALHEVLNRGRDAAIVTLQPDDQQALFSLAQAADTLGQPSVAIQAYKGLLKFHLDPSTRAQIRDRIKTLLQSQVPSTGG